MNLSNILIGICTLLFLMVGADKFLMFLEPPCSLMGSISPIIWKGLGVLQILGGVLIWLPQFRKYVIGFFFVFMLAFTIVHLTQGTSDVGGSVFMAILLGLLIWNPSFIRSKKSTS